MQEPPKIDTVSFVGTAQTLTSKKMFLHLKIKSVSHNLQMLPLLRFKVGSFSNLDESEKYCNNNKKWRAHKLKQNSNDWTWRSTLAEAAGRHGCVTTAVSPPQLSTHSSGGGEAAVILQPLATTQCISPSHSVAQRKTSAFVLGIFFFSEKDLCKFCLLVCSWW